jgi:hypothetical protein
LWITSPLKIKFGRTPVDNCKPFDTTVCNSLVQDGFESQYLEKETTIDAVIGPSGGDRGYSSITGRSGWGIAWYLNNKVIE